MSTPSQVALGKRVAEPSGTSRKQPRLVREIVTIDRRYAVDDEEPVAEAPEAEPEAPELPPPNMKERGRGEVEMTAHLLEVLTGAPATTQGLWRALADGDALERTDSVFHLGNLALAFEWDGYHQKKKCHSDLPESQAKDTRKTRRILDAHPNVLVLRARAYGAPPLQLTEHGAFTDDELARVVQVPLSYNDSYKHGVVVRAIAAAAGPALARLGAASDVVARLEHAAAHAQKSATAMDVVHATYLQADAAYKKAMEQLRGLVDTEEQTRILLGRNGVKTRLADVVKWWPVVKADLKLSTAQMVTLTTHCVVNRLTSTTFRAALRLLVVDFGFAPSDMATFLNDCLAKRLEDSGYVQSIRLVQQALQLESGDLVTLMNGCLACRLHKATYRDALVDFVRIFSFSPSQAVTVLHDNSTSKRVEEAGFRAALLDLKQRLSLSTPQLITLMGSSLTCRVERPEFRDALVSFIGEMGFNMPQAVTVLNDNCTTKRVEDPGFRAALVDLKQRLNLSVPQLTTLMCGSLTCRVERPEFRDAIDSFIQEMEFDLPQAVTVLQDSCTTKRVEDASFRAALLDLKQRLNLSVSQLTTLMGGSLACRVERPEFRDALSSFTQEMGFDLPQAVTVLGDSSTTKRVEEVGFRAALVTVQQRLDLSPAQLTTFMCNGVAKRVQKESFRDALYTFCDTFAFTPAQTATCMKDSLACRLEDERTIPAMRWLLERMPLETVVRFSGSFWEAIDPKFNNLYQRVITLLLDEYGYDPVNLPLRNDFWVKLKKPGAFDAFVAHIAECRTPSHVTKHVATLNGYGSTKPGATRCKHARPRHAPTPVAAQPQKQAKLASFFKS